MPRDTETGQPAKGLRTSAHRLPVALPASNRGAARLHRSSGHGHWLASIEGERPTEGLHRLPLAAPELRLHRTEGLRTAAPAAIEGLPASKADGQPRGCTGAPAAIPWHGFRIEGGARRRTGCAVGVQSNANRGAAPAATGCTGAPATATLEASIEGGTANRGAAHVAYKASSSPSERVLRKPCHGIPKPANRPRGCARRRTGCQWLCQHRTEGLRGCTGAPATATGLPASKANGQPRGCTGCHWLHRSSGCIEPKGLRTAAPAAIEGLPASKADGQPRGCTGCHWLHRSSGHGHLGSQHRRRNGQPRGGARRVQGV